mmetsp:Transcript_138856/g.346176  ORF Transcript_138856/g.346176 Transcript_138856/m.346176 type:complete len:288 (+) Transcript_138856:65-928(+)
MLAPEHEPFVFKGSSHEDAIHVQQELRLKFSMHVMLGVLDIQPNRLLKAMRQTIDEGVHNIAWERQYTPMHMAAEVNAFQVVEFLVALGVDVEARDFKGRTAANIAHARNNTECLEVLAQFGTSAIHSTRRHQCPRRSDVPVPALVTPSVAATMRRAQREEEGRSLQRAMPVLVGLVCEQEKLHQPEAKALLELVAVRGNPRVLVPQKWTTPTHMAVVLGNTQLLCLLLALRAEPSSVDSAARTPLHLAALTQQWSCFHVLRAVCHRCGPNLAVDIQNPPSRVHSFQ